jgi:hypothetical protein
MRFVRILTVAALAGSATACDLDVTNLNQPNRGIILSDPTEVEALAAAQFQAIIIGTLGSNGTNTGTAARAGTGMKTASLMNTSSNANDCMGPRGVIPRTPIDNSVGNPCQIENFSDFQHLSGVARTSTDVLLQLNEPGFTFGTTAAAANRLTRLRAWAHFTNAMAYGYLSLVYDSAAVTRVADAPGFIPPLESYSEVNAFALAQFDSAIAYAQRPGTPALEPGWLNGAGATAPVSMDEFIRIIRSYKAQMRADVARTPAERAAVNWEQVIADATAGIQADFRIGLAPSSNWDYSFLGTGWLHREPSWHQMNYYAIGMGDTSGAYDQWLATPRNDRRFFTVVTPDRRFPQGATRAEQNRPPALDDTPLPAGQYFRNRDPGKDGPSTGWGASQYDHYRFRALADAGRVGTHPILTKAQVDLLRAEGHIRRNDIATAVELINRTRVANGGLPAVTGAGPVPGGASCVPRVPAPPSFTSTVCGNLMDALRWEYWLETAYTGYGVWFFANRGWGVLPVGTAFHWPVPHQELGARQQAPYNLGGVGLPGGAAESIYGFGTGDR